MAESEQNRIRRNVNNLHKQSYVTNRNSYTRDSTIRIEGLQITKGEAIKVIEETEAITGLNTVLAVVDNVDSGTCDVTLDSKENAVKLLHGIEINDVEYNVSLIFSDTTVVSFMKLPSYIEDEEIISKLQAKGIKLVSPVYRRAIPGTQVADGTRFVKCVFPPGFVALPWTIGFKQGSTTKYYRVVHNNQTKVCSLCMSAEHVQRQCPHFICKRCGEQGHTKRRCHTKECIRCKEFPLNCRCCENDESDETSYDGRCHYDDHNGDRHGNDGIGNGYGRNGFGAPKGSEHGRRQEKEDQECDDCGKINCMCSICFACGRDKCIFLCIKCGHFPCECNDNCMYCGNDPCICICQDCSNNLCECICQKCNTASCDCSNANFDAVNFTAIVTFLIFLFFSSAMFTAFRGSKSISTITIANPTITMSVTIMIIIMASSIIAGFIAFIIFTTSTIQWKFFTSYTLFSMASPLCVTLFSTSFTYKVWALSLDMFGRHTQ
jgi:hypothetical protein